MDMGSSHSSPTPSPPLRESQVYPGLGPLARAGGSATSRPELSRTGVIRNSVNVRRSSLRLEKNDRGVLLFKFDSAIETKFRIYFKCVEYLNEKKFPILASDLDIVETAKLAPGLDQSYSIELPSGPEADFFPLVIETVPSGDGDTASQLTYIDLRNNRPVATKQKLRYGDRGYELHEIFGIEKSEDKSPASIDDDENGTDCVICLTNQRDTTIIPCLHLCLCSQCAQVLSLNTRKCPVCRTPATGLLQIDRDLPPPSPVSTGRAARKLSD